MFLNVTDMRKIWLGFFIVAGVILCLGLAFYFLLEPIPDLSKFNLRYSFTDPPFISPRIIEDLSSWKGEEGDQVVAINVPGSQGSNRYYGEIMYENPHVYVTNQNDDESAPHIYSYQYIDKTHGGIYILKRSHRKEGAIISQSILFTEFQKDRGIKFVEKGSGDPDKPFSRHSGFILNDDTPERILIKKLGEIPLEENWKGEVTLNGNVLVIEKVGELNFENPLYRRIKSSLHKIASHFFDTPFRLDSVPYSLNFEPYINPKLIHDLEAWISDAGDQVVAIDLFDSQNSARYQCEGEFGEGVGETTYAHMEDGWREKHYGGWDRDPFFEYSYIGQTDNGIYVLLSRECTGGMGIFPRLLMVTFEKDQTMIIDWDRKLIRKDKNRLLIRKVGKIALNDHWIGELNVEGNKLFIGSDVGRYAPKNEEGDPLNDTSAILEIIF